MILEINNAHMIN